MAVHISSSGCVLIGRGRRGNVGEESERSEANWRDGESGIVTRGSLSSMYVELVCVWWLGRLDRMGEEVGGWVRETVVACEGRMGAWSGS